MRSSALPVAVIGAGRWGALHAAKLHAIPGVHVVVVVDPDPARARRLADRVGARPFSDLRGALDEASVRAASIAVPHDALAPAAQIALEGGLHVLVEKPLALRVSDAQHLVSTAKSAGLLLKVGFLERFNPAIAGWRPTDFLIARRVGPVPTADLTLDWLVHDLDLAHWLFGDDLRVRRADVQPDRVRVELIGRRGTARLTARVGDAVRRRLRDAQGTRDLVGAGDPLGAQMQAFVAAIQGTPDPRLADGADALRVLERVAELRRLAAE